MRRLHGISIIAALMVVSPTVVHAQTVSAVWDANPSSDQVTSYQVCIGTSSFSCDFQQVTVPASATSHTFTPNSGVLYRVAVRAISAAGAGYYSPEILTSIPSLTQPGNQTSAVNVPISPLSLSASDPDGGSLQFSHTGLPFGLSLNQSTGIVAGTPTSTGTFNVTVFVFDGLVSVSRAFTWTVNTGGGDTTAPTLAITSHTNGQTVNTSTITLAGTATDSGTGGSGVNVTVNGTAATGGTATGNNTANWSRSVTLANGSNVLTVVARDNANNARTTQITINRSGGTDTTAPTLVIASHTNGQTVSTSSIMLSGTATDSGAGGSGITSVTVNGSTAAGGVTTGNNTANWGRTVTLANGANVFTIAARDGANNTRTTQITINYAVVQAVLTAGTVSPNAGSTATQTFSAQYTDSLGANDLSYVYLKFATSPNGATNTCMVRYDRAAARLALRNDAGAWLTGVAIPGTGTQQNSQCSIAFAGSSVSISGQTMTLNVSITFNAAYAGAKNIYSYAASTGGPITDWQQRGTWTVPGSTTPPPPPPPTTLTAGTVTPNAGSTATQTFSAQYSDPLGVNDIATVYVKFHTAAVGATNTCMVMYSRATNRLSLRDNAGAWLPGVTIPGAGTQQNSQCSINFAGSSATASGQTLTLNVAVTFNSAFGGAKNIYSYAASVGGLITDWQQRGTWTVPGSSGPALTAGTVTPNAGSGATQTFSAQYTDTFGVSDIAFVYLRVSATANGPTNTCMVRYDRAAGLLSLRDDAGIWQPGRTFAQGGTQTNSQCTVNFSGSSVTVSGQTLTLNAALTFAPAYAGAKNIYLYAQSVTGAFTDWQQRGTWTAP